MKATHKKAQQDSNKPEVWEVDPKGSLGLLALGYVGLKKWREARREAAQKGASAKKKS